MQHRRIVTVFALVASLGTAACSGGEQSMNDSAAAQAGAGTTDAGGAATPATGSPGSATSTVRDTTDTSAANRDSTRMGNPTATKTPTKTP